MQKRGIKNVRLSKNVVPIEYNVELKPDLDNFTFSGVETINLNILKPTKTLTLHSKEIEVLTAHLLHGGEKVFAKKISYDEKAQTVTFTFGKNIAKGKTKLVLVWNGILNDKMRGFYRSKYTVGDKEYHMATTQFEATDARRAFPCFDEPAHKSIFHVSLVVPKGKTAISNTLPVSVLEHSAGYEVVKFSPTPVMSTYLLAFIVGDFEYIESKTKKGVLVRVFTTPGKKHQAKFALDCAVKTLEFYESYFAISYPLPVLDMIAIPDFSSGAMENWGAITYRESALLVDEDHSSIGNKQWVALVIAHEIAHQWFGNLVTMEWWTHLWLNEGFASYIEYLAVDKLFPKWDIWTQFSTADLGVALRLDALQHTHPIEVPVHHPDEIGEIFDEVSYSKGASVIRMLAEYLGEKNFRDGLRHYLKKHSYQNTETLHLWKAFEKVSGKPVAKMMHNWTSKPGYPVVKAEMIKGKINFSQERFFANPLSRERVKDKTKWEIPITFKHNKVNFGESGFFRTAYSKDLLEKLREPILNKKLSARDRLGVIRDLFALSEAGTIRTTEALEFISAYKNEDNYTVWAELATGLARLEQILAREKITKELNALTISLFSPVLHKLGWEKRKDDSHTDGLLRSLVISRLGRAGDKKVIAEAMKKFALIKKGQHVNPDIRGAIYSVVATNGGMKEYEDFIKLYKKETLHEEKNRIGGNLGDFQDPKILKLVCEFALSKYVRIQDTVGVLSGVGANPIGRDIWWSYIGKNWKTLVARYGEGGLTLARAIKSISGSAEEKHLKAFKKFFATHEAPGAKRAIDQVIERLEGNMAWLKRDKKSITTFLSSYFT
ncbi:MAG: M1 family metallopeptidase [Candidatus Pacebacteria bacterium]|nr:M1 family metallopeptidase [Candidatus Paceibacterota bacterium]